MILPCCTCGRRTRHPLPLQGGRWLCIACAEWCAAHEIPIPYEFRVYPTQTPPVTWEPEERKG